MERMISNDTNVLLGQFDLMDCNINAHVSELFFLKWNALGNYVHHCEHFMRSKLGYREYRQYPTKY